MWNGKNGSYPKEINIWKSLDLVENHDAKVCNHARDSWRLCIYTSTQRSGSIDTNFVVLAKCGHLHITCDHTRDSWRLCIYTTTQIFCSISANFLVLEECGHHLATCSRTI